MSVRQNKMIAVVLSDTLSCLGLQNLFDNYFPEMEVRFFASFKELPQKLQSDSFAYYFTDADTFAMHLDYFLTRRNKTVLLNSNKDVASLPANMVSTRLPLEQMIEQFERCLRIDETVVSQPEKGKGLSEREINVLRQIVKGFTNREIADHLNISLNTVLSHRKNITAKLGIKTVSGLTFYAMMNGIVSLDEINM
ncbi:MAG TPA: helix-turn-helix transcriptional regulator [Parabacteroides sp.]|nr:helix-turn-helix transcriptional regulator [Parabacteroides sp.]